jgi:hypothetical protein
MLLLTFLLFPLLDHHDDATLFKVTRLLQLSPRRANQLAIGLANNRNLFIGQLIRLAILGQIN